MKKNGYLKHVGLNHLKKIRKSNKGVEILLKHSSLLTPDEEFKQLLEFIGEHIISCEDSKPETILSSCKSVNLPSVPVTLKSIFTKLAAYWPMSYKQGKITELSHSQSQLHQIAKV